MIRQESQFSAFAKSGKSAYGLMQILPSTARMVNKKYKLKLKNFKDLHHWSVNKRECTIYIER